MYLDFISWKFMTLWKIFHQYLQNFDQPKFFFSKVTGSITLIMTRLMEKASPKKSEKSTTAIWTVLCNFDVIMTLISISAATTAHGFIESFVEIRLETFSLSVTSIGQSFIALAASYTVATLSSGYLLDKIMNPEALTILSFSLILISFTLIGPVPYIPLPSI